MKPNKKNSEKRGTGAGGGEWVEGPEIAAAIAEYSRAQGWALASVKEHEGYAGAASILRGWLASNEQAAGPLLQAVQGHLDKGLCERLLFTLHRRMVGNGRKPAWFPGGLRKVRLVRDDGAESWEYVQQSGEWDPTFSDALGAGLLALAQWRAGGAVEGHDVGASCVAWRAMVASVDADNWGDSPAGEAAKVELGEWLKLVSVGAHPDEVRREWHLERLRVAHAVHRTGRRLAAVESMRDDLAAGRGRRAALADKVKHAAVLLLAGHSAANAAAAAGFKPSESKGRGGKVDAAARLAAALKRAGKSIVSRRAMWADDCEFQAAVKRGGAAADLAVTFGGFPPLPPFVPSGSSPVEVPPVHPLARAASGLPSGFEVVGTSGKRPASRAAVLAVAGGTVKAKRLRGVWRARAARPPSPVRAASVDASSAAAWVNGEYKGARVARAARPATAAGSGCWSRVVPPGHPMAEQGHTVLMFANGFLVGSKLA